MFGIHGFGEFLGGLKAGFGPVNLSFGHDFAIDRPAVTGYFSRLTPSTAATGVEALEKSYLVRAVLVEGVLCNRVVRLMDGGSMNRSLFRLGLSAVLAFVLCVANSPAFAQGGSGTAINGRVVDASGGVLPGATVTAKHLATNVVSSTVSNAEGNFSLPSLPTGTYEVTVALEGFKTTVVKDVVITAAQGATVNAALEVGGVTEQVTVASSSEIIQTQSSTISSTITTNQITKLPLTSRSAMDFVNFLPGVSTPGGNRQGTINGLPQGVINITLDGINIQDNTNRSTDGFFAIVSPRLDAIEEVSVTTAGQGADAGQGAVQVKFTTRSGGNTYSGSAYHYYRNDALNANTWFNNRSQLPKAALLQNQFGARLGGPLVIPGLLSRGKAFFFGNYEELRQPSETERTRNLMNAGAQNGTFTLASGASFNVLNFAASRGLPGSTIDPTIAKLLQDIRTAAGSTGSVAKLDANVEQLRYNVPVESKRIFPTGKLDFNITDNHRFTSAINYNWFRDFPDTLNSRDANWPGFPVEAGQNSIRLGWSNSVRSTLGRNLVNEFRVGYSGAPVKFFDEMNVGMYTGSIANTKGFHLNFPGLTSGLTGPGAAPIPQSRDATDLAFDDNLTWLRGNHNITAGASYSMYKVWLKNSSLVPSVNFGITSSDPANAAFSSANVAAFAGATPTTAELTAARNLYALLTGRISSITGDARINESTGQYEYLGVGIQRARMEEAGFYLQDSWRMRPNFTLNGGLRWSLQMPFTADNNSYSTTTLEDICGRSGVSANPAAQTGFCNLFQPGAMPGKAQPQFYNLAKGERAYNTDWNNFAPNVGFAWTPARRGGLLGTLMSDELVLRGGWSRAFSREGMGRYTGELNSNPGVAITANRSEGLGNLYASGVGAPLLYRNDAQLGAPAFAATPSYPMTDVITEDIRMFDPNLEVAYADSWSFGVQRKLTTNMALEVRYVGTRSDNALASRNQNEINIVENNFINEFRNAQKNLQANIAAGRGNTFAFTGAPGTVPLPIFLAHYNASTNSGSAAAYTGTSWTNQTFLNFLAAQNPNPYGFASTNATNGLLGNATFRNNAINAGLARNFWVANPEHLGGAIVVTNSHKTRYHSLQLELRRRLADGLQFQTSYVYGRALQTAFLSHRADLGWFRDVGSPGDLAHQFKLNMVYDLPFGQGQRFMSGAGPVLDRIVGGWQIGFNTRLQSGMLVDAGNVRLVGWTADEVQKAFKLRFENDAKQIFMFPADVIENTMRAFSASPTSASGYTGVAPTGRYFAPANGPDCVEVIQGSGECGGTRELVLQGPMFEQSDLRIAKRTTLVGRVNLELSAEALNVFNTANFVPNGTAASATLTNFLVTGLTGTNTSRVIQLVSRINW